MHIYLLPGLRSSPRLFICLFRVLPAERIDLRPDPERFSPREVAAHLADWEPILRDRIRQAVEQTGITLTAYDEGAMAEANGYSVANVDDCLARFAKERELTALYVQSLDGEVWDHTVIHPERGPQSAYDLANLILGHDLYHAEQVAAHLSAD